MAMDEQHLAAAIRYVLMNPVRAGLTEKAADWPWSSARELLGLEAEPDPLLPFRDRSALAELL